MKKLMSYIAVVALVLTFTACGNKDNEVINNNPPVNDEINRLEVNSIPGLIISEYDAFIVILFVIFVTIGGYHYE